MYKPFLLLSLLLFAGTFSLLHAQQSKLGEYIQSLPTGTHPDTLLRLKLKHVEEFVNAQDYQRVFVMYTEMDSLVAAHPNEFQYRNLYQFKFVKVSTSLTVGNLPLAQKQIAELIPFVHGAYYEVPFYKVRGTYYQYEGQQPDSALYFFQKAITLYEPDSLPRELVPAAGGALGNIGIMFFDEGNYDSALHYLEQATQLFTKHDLRHSALNSKLNIGGILASAKRYETAAEYFKEVYESTDEVGYEADMKYYALTNWLRTVLDRKAEDYRLKQLVLETFQKTDQPQFMRSRFEMAHALAEYEKLHEKYPEALEFAQKALAAGEAVAAPGEIVQALTLAGDVQIRLKQPQKALTNLEKALTSEQYCNPMEKRALYNNLRKAYAEVGDLKNTVKFTDKYLAAADSINKQQVTEQLAEQEVRFKTEKKEQENLLLKEQNKTNEAEIQAKNRQNIILFVSVLALIVVVGLVVQIQLRQKKNNAILRNKNNEIEAQSEELKQTNLRLNELSEFKESLTHMLVHDLKTPLSTILHYAKQTEITRAGQYILHLVNNLLDVKKLEEAAMQVKPNAIPLQPLFVAAEKSLSGLFQHKDVQFKTDFPTEIGVMGDYTLLLRSLENLLNNAAKFTPQGSEVRLSAEISGNKLQLHIEDSGAGIPKKAQEHIFEKFYQAEARKAGQTASTGLGLTFCKLAAEAQGGSIRVGKSNALGGAMFTLELPLAPKDTAKHQKKLKSEVKEITFTAQDSDLRIALYETLKDTETYMFSEVEEVLAETELRSPTLIEWSEELRQAAIYGNEARYTELIQQLEQ